MDPLAAQIANIKNRNNAPAVTPVGTIGGYTPHPGHRDHVTALRTYNSDLADAIRDGKGSVVKIAIAEDEKRHREHENISATSKKNITLLVVSLILVAVATGALFGVAWYKKSLTVVVPVATPAAPAAIIATDGAGTIDITGKLPNEIIASIQSTIAGLPLPDGTMENIFFSTTSGAAKTRVGALAFLQALGMNPPDTFTRTLSDDFEFAAYHFTTNNTILVLRGTAHDYLLSGMLAWEPHLMADMAPLFGIDTTGANSGLLTAPFADTLIENHDTRAVLNSSGTPVLFYSFLDEDTIIFATDPATLLEAVRRFNA